MDNINNEVVEAEFEEVVEEAVAPQPQPLRVRVVFYEGSPMDFTLEDLTADDFKSFIANHVEVKSNGFFFGKLFVPRTDIKYFEQV